MNKDHLAITIMALLMLALMAGASYLATENVNLKAEKEITYQQYLKAFEIGFARAQYEGVQKGYAAGFNDGSQNARQP